MKIYIATTLSNAKQHNALRDYLADSGVELTYDWTIQGSVAAESEKEIEAVAVDEVHAVQQAEAVVMLISAKRGTHVELGMALALNKPVVFYGDPDWTGNLCVFYYHPLVHLVDPQLGYRGILAALEHLVLR